MAREGGSYVINASGQPVLRERTGAVLSRPRPKPKPHKPAAKEEAKDTLMNTTHKVTPEANRDADT